MKQAACFFFIIFTLSCTAGHQTTTFREVTPAILERLEAAACAGLELRGAGQGLAEPAFTPRGTELGIAVRIQEAGKDRGCLALYAGVSDLEEAARYCAWRAADDPRYSPVPAGTELAVEVSVFGPWKTIDSPLDFIAGSDSLLLFNLSSATLLQAPVAAKLKLDREGFLRILSRKAGLGPDGWKRQGLTFKRAATVSTTCPYRIKLKK